MILGLMGNSLLQTDGFDNQNTSALSINVKLKDKDIIIILFCKLLIPISSPILERVGTGPNAQPRRWEKHFRSFLNNIKKLRAGYMVTVFRYHRRTL